MTYSEAIDWLFSTQLFGIKLGLDGPRQLLKQYLAFPAHGVTVVHVAGTNGKGSTCAMIDAIARTGGHRCGLFTSPHLVDFRERIRVGGEEIPEDACAAMLTELRELCETLDPHPTFFEITLALGMRWFRERECEVIVLETGMGGRLDATTAVPADVCAITPIGLDHTQWLGETIAEIAREKAGILVEGKPCFSAPQDPQARRVLEMEANERRSPLSFVEAPLRGYPIGLPGEHQAWNAALAVECAHAAGLRVNYEVLIHALAQVSWPGRFEVLSWQGKTMVLDGAHNPQGAGVLAKTWRERFGESQAGLLFSVVAAKDLVGIARELGPLAEVIHVVAVDSPRALPTDALAEAFGGREVTEHASLSSAMSALEDFDGPLLVAGSLFLIGDVKAWLEELDHRASDQ
ncbi:dihydrofolate synthase/folylpolyglutamate synthase [Haloferula luteola]|uniref:Dihydrofolate synthase/folylpolyglutamate synthase n=1 Tax=Haloferula luteola TaxID=595692 RepID=A0A840UWR3_9BACT|nr:folylpolyglutamate synthase/dihydrofolate synthase family protein [Haloferula luteola]MBB5350165.1 dihydrofolate synthase/folylpolyglutamate synthase [Haloferula luteola]